SKGGCQMRSCTKFVVGAGAWVLAACGVLGPLTDRGESETSSSNDSTDSTTTVSGANGADLTADSNSEVAGTTVSIPAGALAIDTAVTIGEGTDLLDDNLAQDLQLSGDDAATLAGPAVVIDSA